MRQQQPPQEPKEPQETQETQETQEPQEPQELEQQCRLSFLTGAGGREGLGSIFRVQRRAEHLDAEVVELSFLDEAGAVGVERREHLLDVFGSAAVPGGGRRPRRRRRRRPDVDLLARAAAHRSEGRRIPRDR